MSVLKRKTKQNKSVNQEIARYAKAYNDVDKSGFYSMITKHLKTILFDSEFYHKLDNNPYKIAFQDGIYDMRENKFNKGYSDYDYITKQFHLIIHQQQKNKRILLKISSLKFVIVINHTWIITWVLWDKH